MMRRPVHGRRWFVAGAVMLASAGGAARLVVGSDHQDTPYVEFNPKSDLTDVYAFPGSAAGRRSTSQATFGKVSSRSRASASGPRDFGGPSAP